MDFEAPQRRRIAVLCSHLCPSHIDSRNTQIVSTSNCSSESTTTQLQTRDLAKNPSSKKDCVFCQIICGNSPAFKLYEDDMCLCILDTSPLSRGHSLLIPKRHFCSLDTTPPSVMAAMCSKLPFISNAIKKAAGCGSGDSVTFGEFANHKVTLEFCKTQGCPWKILNPVLATDSDFRIA
ncbi:adenylylsulfatase HINT3 isoform X3 [Spinacia oleracea]|uniref:Adenylylsulfatase HINT3 isoform X3 n=1 Tax=Spinacia oleracea TaxID=3562 RepID=A0A9R0J8N3_SPIOL|nr:adenylylsulfatase HINT3 isoform X3 [Spinacia oleracea]